MITYEVTVTRDSGMWAAVVGGLPPHMTGAIDVEHFAKVEAEVRDLIAVLTDAPDLDSFDLRWRVLIDGHDVTAEVLALGNAEAALEDAVTAREGARSAVLKALAKAGLSQAAIGDVLRLSHQRVHQLLKGSSPQRRIQVKHSGTILRSSTAGGSLRSTSGNSLRQLPSGKAARATNPRRRTPTG
jgi:hypothetical protein